MDKDTYLETLKDNLPALGEIELEFYDEVPADLFEMLTDQEKRAIDLGFYTPVSNYPQTGSEYKDNCEVVKVKDGVYVVVYQTDLFHEPEYVMISTEDDNHSETILNEPTETEPAPAETEPVATEPAPGTGGTEPVTAPQTADRLALISGILVISLVLCAAVFTVMKEKSR